MPPRVRTADQIIGGIASAAYGIVTHEELCAANLTVDQIRTRRERGSLIVVFRGVYRVGHAAPSTEALYIAAIKACGERAVVSGRAAAHLWGLIRGDPPPAEVTAPTERRIEGVHVRRCRKLDRRDTTKRRAIPITTVPRTLVDLAGILGEEDLARAVHEAHVRWKTTPAQVEAVLRRNPNAKGAQALRRVVNGETPVLLSRLEKLFRKLLKTYNLPLPKTNVHIEAGYIDCRWPEHRLTVELDSYRHHATRHAFELDRKRERDAYARRDQFRRYTWGDVCEGQTAMLAELFALLS
jgi:predicted transcriptional regulator of viral defense system